MKTAWISALVFLVALAFPFGGALAQEKPLVKPLLFQAIRHECDPTDFHTDFAPSNDPNKPAVWLRHFGGAMGRMVAAASFYPASRDTKLKVRDPECSRGPYAAPTLPRNMHDQTTVQQTGDRAGVVMFSKDCLEEEGCFRNPHWFYGYQEIPLGVANPWENPEGDDLYIEVDLRMTMLYKRVSTSGKEPIGQLYLAFNLTDRSSCKTEDVATCKVMLFSLEGWDIRSRESWLACDGASPDGGGNHIFTSTFERDATGCPRPKTFVIPPDSATSVFGGDCPDGCAWSTPRIFKATLTRAGLLAAIFEANENKTVSDFSTDLANYSVTAFGCILETNWEEGAEINMASQCSNIKVEIRKAQ